MCKLLAVLLSLWLCAPVYAQQSKSALTTEINTDFADNTTGAITAALVRTVTTDIVNSYVDWLTCTGTGGIIFYNAGTPTCRTAGVDGQTLIFNGVPSWQYITAGTISGSVTNATNATNLTTTNDTATNATYFPTFQTASGGTNPLKTSNAKLTYNPSTGRLSATDFAGTFAGNTLTTGTFTITGTAAKTLTFTNSVTLTGTDAAVYTFPNATATIPRTVASGAKALATGAIASAACTAAQTDTATGTLTTDGIVVSFNADPTAVTGYVPLTSGMLTIIYYPTADTVNFKVCNNTANSITPGAVTINWRVLR